MEFSRPYLNCARACTLGWESTFMAKCWWCRETRKDPCCCHLVGMDNSSNKSRCAGWHSTHRFGFLQRDWFHTESWQLWRDVCHWALRPSCFTEHFSWPEEARVCQSSCHRWDGYRTHVSPRSLGTATCKLPLWAVPELGHWAASLQGQVTALPSLLHFRGWLETLSSLSVVWRGHCALLLNFRAGL